MTTEGPICLDCKQPWTTGHKCQPPAQQPLAQYQPRTELVRQLLEIRARIVADGGPLLSLEEINGEHPPAQHQPQTCATCRHKTPNLAHCDRYTLSLLQVPRGWGCNLGWEALG